VRFGTFAVVAALAGGAVGCAASSPQPGVAATSPERGEQVAPDVRHRRVTDPAGPFVLNVVTVDLRSRDYELRQVRARDSIAGRERLTAMVARQPGGAGAVIAAINADFFSLQTGESENNVVIDGEWWKGVRATTSPFDAYGNYHSQFGVDAAGKPMIDRFAFHGTVVHGGAAFPISSVNHFPRVGSEAVVLYTQRFGTTPPDTARVMAEAPLRRVTQRGDTIVYVLSGPTVRTGRNRVAQGGAVLAAYGPRALKVASFRAGDTVVAVLRASGNRGDLTPFAPRLLIGGWPRILRGGVNVAARAPWDEATVSSNAEARHPRSAVGFNRDSTTLYLVTVDGRQQASVGMTLVELAEFMKREGVWDALNFDGGGSTTLVVNGAIANKPSEASGEREIANALMLVRRR
jgi:hypothetical protein